MIHVRTKFRMIQEKIVNLRSGTCPLPSCVDIPIGPHISFAACSHAIPLLPVGSRATSPINERRSASAVSVDKRFLQSALFLGGLPLHKTMNV